MASLKGKTNYFLAIFEPYIREIANLWLFVLIAALSFVFFSGSFFGLAEIDQISEVYRVFALNPSEKRVAILYSIFSVFTISFFILERSLIFFYWMKGEEIEREEAKRKEIRGTLIAFLSSVPLLSLFTGIFRSFLKTESDQFFPNLTIVVCLLFILTIAFYYIAQKALKNPKETGRVLLIIYLLILLLILGFFLFLVLLFLALFITSTTKFSNKIVGFIVKRSPFPFLFKQGNSLEAPIQTPAETITPDKKNEGFFNGFGFYLLLLYPVFILISVLAKFRFLNPFSHSFLFSVFLTLHLFIYISIVQCLHTRQFLLSFKSGISWIIWSAIWSVACVVLFSLSSPPDNPDDYLDSIVQLGPIGIAAIFLLMLFILAFNLYIFGHINKIQSTAFVLIVILPILLAVVISARDWNDNHQIRLIAGARLELQTLDQSFGRWKDSREKEDAEKFIQKDKSFPIYIVSAQGGGIFAAYHAAATLARLQDLCPAFAHHVFAISGVSGGSLGAAAFSSLVKAVHPQGSQDCPGEISSENLTKKEYRGPLEKKAHDLLDQDLLSPLLGVGLFPDFFQRFIPVSIGSLDRARGLEYAFERGWNNIKWGKDARNEHPSLLAQSYYGHWTPENDAAPALVLNTTVVETGERLLLSPFTFAPSDPTLLDSRFPLLEDIDTVACLVDKDRHHIDFPLSTAAVLSARFPLVTPVGWFNRCKDRNGAFINVDKDGNPILDKDGNPTGIKSRLADGGYFENSGFSTAFEIGQRLEIILKGKCLLEGQDPMKDKCFPEDQAKDKTEDNKLKFKIVYLALTDSPPLKSEAGGLNELMSPSNALFNSRDARGRSVIEQAEYQIDDRRLTDDQIKNLSNHRFRQFYLNYAPDHTPGSTKLGSTKVNACKLGSKPTDCSAIGADLNLPLGWYLSTASQDYIRNRIGNPIACSSDNSNINHCVMKSIVDELK